MICLGVPQLDWDLRFHLSLWTTGRQESGLTDLYEVILGVLNRTYVCLFGTGQGLVLVLGSCCNLTMNPKRTSLSASSRMHIDIPRLVPRRGNCCRQLLSRHYAARAAIW